MALADFSRIEVWPIYELRATTETVTPQNWWFTCEISDDLLKRTAALRKAYYDHQDLLRVLFNELQTKVIAPVWWEAI